MHDNLARWAGSAALGLAAAAGMCWWGCTQAIGLDKDYHLVEDAGPGACTLPEASAACPNEPGTAQMKEVPGGYCIDKTEVTVQQYFDWLAKNPVPGDNDMPTPCAAFKKNLWPGDGGVVAQPPVGTENLPVTNVDWCDAYLYCKMNHKRLCHTIGSSVQVPPAKGPLCGASQWYTACSSGGRLQWPYGDTEADYNCNAGNAGLTAPEEVSKPKNTCQSSMQGYQDIENLVGNVAEWEDSCESTAEGANDICYTRGGSFHADPNIDFSCSTQQQALRSLRTAFIGFRCCYP